MQTTSISAEGGANPRHPATVRSRDSDGHVRIGDDVELSDLARKVSAGDTIVTNLKQVPHTTKPTTGAANHTVVQTKAQRLRARIQFATLCWTLYVIGWNDGTTGPLLPRIQKVYNVGVLVVLACWWASIVLSIDVKTYRSTLWWFP